MKIGQRWMLSVAVICVPVTCNENFTIHEAKKSKTRLSSFI